MGYGENTKGYRVYFQDNQRIELARDVAFAPHVPDTERPEPYVELQEEDLLLEEEQPNKQTNDVNVENGDDEPQSTVDIEEGDDNNINVDEPGMYNLRNRANLKRPVRMDDYETYSCSLATENEPLSFEEATTGENKKQWKKAIQEEITNLKKKDTWEVVERPENVKAIDSKWVFRQKNLNGEIVKKARLVARGYQQDECSSYDMYSPVARMVSIRVLLSLCIEEDMVINQLDVK
ncbi:hypothetical protein Trydic_g12484, partial [Trypoxylus dichotomus]